MQTSSQDFCASAKQTQTLTATLLQPCTSRHERKHGSAVTGKASEQHALLHRCSQASSCKFKAILCQRKHAKTCHCNVHACPCTKLSRFVKNSVHAKVFSKRSTQLDCCSREPKSKQKESYFSQKKKKVQSATHMVAINSWRLPLWKVLKVSVFLFFSIFVCRCVFASFDSSTALFALLWFCLLYFTTGHCMITQKAICVLRVQGPNLVWKAGNRTTLTLELNCTHSAKPGSKNYFAGCVQSPHSFQSVNSSADLAQPKKRNCELEFTNSLPENTK